MKIRLLIVLILLSQVSFAKLFKFSGEWSEGDCYSDGTPLVAGECYAVVWQREGTEFKGFYSDGTLVDPENSEFVWVYVGKQGAVQEKWEEEIYSYCPTYEILVAVGDEKKYGGQTYLYALDTRTGDSTHPGYVDLGPNESGKLTYVAASVQIMKLELKTIPHTETGEVVPQYYYDSAVPEDEPIPLPIPQFSSISLANGIAVLTVTNTVSAHRYGISMTNDVRSVRQAVKPIGEMKQGGSAGPLVWEVDVRADKQGFFNLLDHAIWNE